MKHARTIRSILTATQIILVATLAGAPAIALETSHRELSEELVLGPDRILGAENLIGSITVRTDGKSDAVRIRATVVAEGASFEESDALADAIRIERREENGKVTLHVSYPVADSPAFRMPRSESDGLITKMSKWITPMIRRSTVTSSYDGETVEVGPVRGAASLAVHLELIVPLDVSVDAQQTYGTVHVSGVRGSFDIEALQGGVVAEQIYGDLNVRTGAGEIQVLKYEGARIELRSRTGAVSLVDVRAHQAHIASDEGDISGTDMRAEVMATETGSGSLTLEDVEPRELQITNGSGKVELVTDLARVRQASIRSDSGDVVVRLGELAPFLMTAASETGAVKHKGLARVDIDQREKTAARFVRGKGGSEMTVNTVSGSVLIRSP